MSNIQQKFQQKKLPPPLYGRKRKSYRAIYYVLQGLTKEQDYAFANNPYLKSSLSKYYGIEISERQIRRILSHLEEWKIIYRTYKTWDVGSRQIIVIKSSADLQLDDESYKSRKARDISSSAKFREFCQTEGIGNRKGYWLIYEFLSFIAKQNASVISEQAIITYFINNYRYRKRKKLLQATKPREPVKLPKIVNRNQLQNLTLQCQEAKEFQDLQRHAATFGWSYIRKDGAAYPDWYRTKNN